MVGDPATESGVVTETSFQQDVLAALGAQPAPELALGVDKLIASLGAGKIQEEEFRLAAEPDHPATVAHASSPQKKKRKRSAATLEHPCTWICSLSSRGVMHRCVDGKPLCHEKKASTRATLSKGARTYPTLNEAVAVAQIENRSWCSVCSQLCA